MNVAEPHGRRVWASAAWRSEALEWVAAALGAGEASRLRVGEWRDVPWSAVVAIDRAEGGRFWFKACAPALAYEVPLYAVLVGAVRGEVLEPVAADAGRGWILLPDGGPSLAERDARGELGDALAAHGELQLRLAPRVPAMLDAGVPDMRAERMPERFDEALAAIAREGSGERETIGALEAARPDVARWAARLAGSPVAPSLDHQDLHAGNVFRDRDAGYRFYDWGDAVVAHPFGVLLAALGWIRRDLGCESGDPRLQAARDAYLEPFGHLASHAELVEQLELACRLASITRALGEARALEATRRLGEEIGFPWDGAVAAPLRSVLADR